MQAALLAATVPRIAPAAGPRGDVLLVWDGAFPAPALDPTARGGGTVLVAEAVRGDLPACDALLGRPRWRAVVGLTRDAERFLLTQCASVHGYRLTYTGTHESGPEGTTHVLKGEVRLLGALAEALAGAGPNWPGALVAARDELADAPPGKRRVTLTAARTSQAAPAPWLTSWALSRT